MRGPRQGEADGEDGRVTEPLILRSCGKARSRHWASLLRQGSPWEVLGRKVALSDLHYGKTSLTGLQKTQAEVREIRELAIRQGGDRNQVRMQRR